MVLVDVEQLVADVIMVGPEFLAKSDYIEFDDAQNDVANSLIQLANAKRLVMLEDSIFGIDVGEKRYVFCNAIMEAKMDDETGTPRFQRNVDILLGASPAWVNEGDVYELPLGLRLMVLDPSLIMEVPSV